jgi:hypothetical protein
MEFGEDLKDNLFRDDSGMILGLWGDSGMILGLWDDSGTLG